MRAKPDFAVKNAGFSATLFAKRKLRLAERTATFLAFHACAIGFALAGLLMGWYGLAAGFVIGFMLDLARLEARTRRRLSLFMRAPCGASGGEAASPRLAAAMPGYAAAVCLALRGEWPFPADPETGRFLWERLASAALASDDRAAREGERVADAAARCSGVDLPGLARYLATMAGADKARRLLADWAFAAAALGSGRLDPETELGIRAALGDCGLSSREILAARSASFRGERDPWTVLGLAPGAPPGEIKRAFRALSRAFHPDAGAEPDGARFREVAEAYATLSSMPR